MGRLWAIATEAVPEWSGTPDPEALLASRSSGGFPDPLHDSGRGPGGEVPRHDITALRGAKISMTMHLTKAPHVGARDPLQAAPNAALLIDFDNVTMGMRSDLSKELKTLLNSDVIRGKVTVQRAYADWRRYPQYIVPLSEASIDLIFAPAYGSNKKNATDIRMAIDGIELVFIRPEIGTFILLTGDSDFSSLVLKLKEYGKYVIGVGIQESSSDILVQNCDEYYSYTSLSGLQKTTDSDRQPIDPWMLVERAVEQMTNRDDVMRSDRLKQVMVELDPGFDEGEYGFSKFSRFVTEASSKGLVHIRKLENGQYEVAPAKGGAPRKSEETRLEEPRSRGRGRGGGREGSEARSRARAFESGNRVSEDAEASVPDGPPLQAAYALLRQALERMKANGKDAVRDSDVKRKMRELEAGFDESKLGFSKFSRFLRQASDHGVVDLLKRESGNYEVSLRATDGPGGAHKEAVSSHPALPPQLLIPPPQPKTVPDAPKESALAALGRRFGLRLGTPRSREEPPPSAVHPVAPVQPPASVVTPSISARPDPQMDPSDLGLPTGNEAQVRYLTNRYKGVGKKTAEKLVEGFGEDLFSVLQKEPERVQKVIPQARAENVLEQWKADFDRRTARGGEGEKAQQGRDSGGSAPQARGGEGRQRESGEARRGRGGRGRRGERGSNDARRDQPERSGGRDPEIGSGAVDQAVTPDREADRPVPAPVSAGPVARSDPPESPRAESPIRVAQAPSVPVVQAPPVPAAPESGAAEAPTGPRPGDELEGLEPSRLHSRTSRRGHRR